jgi:hypothetical protein
MNAVSVVVSVKGGAKGRARYKFVTMQSIAEVKG